jgi:hypothetical protein
MASPCSSLLFTLTRSVRPVCRSWMNESNAPFVSPATRLLAKDENTTNLPPALIDAAVEEELPCSPVEETLTRSVVPATTSRTKTSSVPFVSPATRFGALEMKVTKRPEMDGLWLDPFACTSSSATLTRTVRWVVRMWTKTSSSPLVSPETRFEAEESKATKLPVASRAGRVLSSLAWAPLLRTLTRSSVLVARSRTKMSSSPFESPGTSVLAAESNPTTEPSASMAGPANRPAMSLPCSPMVPMLTRSVVAAGTATAGPTSDPVSTRVPSATAGTKRLVMSRRCFVMIASRLTRGSTLPRRFSEYGSG